MLSLELTLTEKNYLLVLIYLKATKKRNDATYLNWKEKRTDSAAKPCKTNGRKIFLNHFFNFISLLSCKCWPQLASKYASFTLLVYVRPYLTKWEDETL